MYSLRRGLAAATYTIFGCGVPSSSPYPVAVGRGRICLVGCSPRRRSALHLGFATRGGSRPTSTRRDAGPCDGARMGLWGLLHGAAGAHLGSRPGQVHSRALDSGDGCSFGNRVPRRAGRSCLGAAVPYASVSVGRDLSACTSFRVGHVRGRQRDRCRIRRWARRPSRANRDILVGDRDRLRCAHHWSSGPPVHSNALRHRDGRFTHAASRRAARASRVDSNDRRRRSRLSGGTLASRRKPSDHGRACGNNGVDMQSSLTRIALIVAWLGLGLAASASAQQDSRRDSSAHGRRQSPVPRPSDQRRRSLGPIAAKWTRRSPSTRQRARAGYTHRPGHSGGALGDSLKNGAIIGAVVVGAWCALVCGQGLDSSGQIPIAVAANAGLGALIGAGIDADHRGRTLLYPRSSTVSRVRGAQASLSLRFSF